jgi:rare lipoprotein A (peptidoglycan hydrolase)
MASWADYWTVKRKIGLALAAILLICGWHACCYDNGRPFNPDALTAASWNYPLGSRLRLIYGNKSVVVEVTDRGGARAFMQFGRVVDLSHAAFAKLERPAVGTLRVKIKRMD